MTPVILSRFQPASWRQLEHFGKIAMTGKYTFKRLEKVAVDESHFGVTKPQTKANLMYFLLALCRRTYSSF